MNKKRLFKIIGGLLIVIIIALCIFFIVGMQSVSKKSDIVKFDVKSGAGRFEIIDDLYEAGIIKSKASGYLYATVNFYLTMKAGNYTFDRNDSLPDILSQIYNGDISPKEITTVVFQEGLTVPNVAKIISDRFDYSYDEVMDIINDKEYLNELIGKYDFLTNDILDEDIYYPLEGYLYPDTYQFYKDSSVKLIIDRMLSQFNNKYLEIKSNIEDSDYTVHDILSIASIVEREAINIDDRKRVSQVIYSRLNIPMSLGMDVTTYYGAKKDMTEVLTKADLDEINGYNTRPTSVLGLPVGPICSPSLDAIIASLNPSETDYLYFYANISDGSVEFFKTYTVFVNYKNQY